MKLLPYIGFLREGPSIVRIAATVFLACLSQLVWANSVQVEGVRIWAAPDSTRVVFDTTAPVEYKLTMLTEPFRAVIDLQQTQFKQDAVQPVASDRYVERLRSATHEKDLRVVLDLKKYARTKIFQLPPNEHYGHRLVVDLFSEEEEKITTPVSIEQEPVQKTLRDVVIAIDAGHGGEDPGALGPSGTHEKDVVLEVAKKLARLVDQEPGMRAVLIREGDYYLKLRKRFEKARQHKADLFISIHADSFHDRRVQGSSVYVLSQRGASSEHARRLADRENASDLVGGVSLESKDDILASVLLDLSQTASLEASIDIADRVLGGLKKVGKLHKQRVESAAFAVLKSPDIPSILVETAYISNPTEEKNLRSSRHQQKLANAIVDGLRTYFYDRPPEGTYIAMQEKNRKHIIARGDTLSGIAQQYRVSLRSLRSTNSLRTDVIRVGQVLTIPVTGS